MQPNDVHSIVIVDDEKSFTEMIGNLLREHFAAPVHTFIRPVDALEKLHALNPGIVVTDYYMPDMNGLDFIRAVYQISPDTHCIVITGHPFNLEEHSQEGLNKLKEVLPKPFRWQQLADTIRRHWAGPQPPALRAGQDSFDR